ncbi:hypothetical protein evm_005326 [Chilo suppressalis]|nr:hypothetical protein evm_005326 [Chilo suppressalis]
MFNTCSVMGCESRRRDVAFYKIPKSETGLLWLKCLKLKHLQNFNSVQLDNSQLRSRLHQSAIPTLFTESEINNAVPDETGNVSYAAAELIDHDYSRKRKHQDHSYCKVEIVKKQKQSQTVFVPTASTSMYEPQSCENLSTTVSMPCPTTSTHKVQYYENQPTSGTIEAKTPKRKYIVHKAKTLSPKCANLYKEFTRARRQLNFSRRARQAMKFSKKESFEKLTQNMNPVTKKLMWLQVRQYTKSSRGRRFTQEEKLIGLSIMKQSPKCYKFLQKIFILPSKHTINKMISNLKVEPGLNPQIFEAVKKEVATWEEKRKFCSILFDEVALDSGVNYNRYKDVINGFVHLNERINEYADHALVFMLRGAVHKWQQPITFFFCKGATSSYQLKKIMKDLVTAVSNAGLIPLALICDQGTSFVASLKSLQEETKREQSICNEITDDTIRINGHSLSIIYDPPHLIKGIRNNFITKDIKYKNCLSKWSDIVDVYNTDCNHAQIRLLHKLNDEHVIPEKIQKMKVKNCVRVLSKTVAATLAYTAQFSHYADGREVSSTLKNTADTVSFFDDLFDSVNGASLFNNKAKGKLLRRAVTTTSQHHCFWKQAITRLKNIRFVDKNGKETSVPSLKNWLTTLQSFQRLWIFFNLRD